MTRDEKIEIVLADFYKSRAISVPDYIYYKFGNANDLTNRQECDELIDFMCSKDLITTETGYNYLIRPNGLEISESGGWIKHQKELLTEKFENDKIKNIELDKLKIDLELSKWNVKTKQLILIITIVVAIVAVLAFFWPILFKPKA